MLYKKKVVSFALAYSSFLFFFAKHSASSSKEGVLSLTLEFQVRRILATKAFASDLHKESLLDSGIQVANPSERPSESLKV